MIKDRSVFAWIWVCGAFIGCKRHIGTLWIMLYILNFNCGNGYAGTCNCQNLRKHTQNMCILMHENYTSLQKVLEKEMATHSSILAWEIPWIEETDGLQPLRLQKSETWLSHKTNNRRFYYLSFVFSLIPF